MDLIPSYYDEHLRRAERPTPASPHNRRPCGAVILPLDRCGKASQHFPVLLVPHGDRELDVRDHAAIALDEPGADLVKGVDADEPVQRVVVD